MHTHTLTPTRTRLALQPPVRRTIDIAPAALFKVLAAVVLVWLWLKLWPLLIVLLMAAVLAIAFEPLVARLEKFGSPRGLAAFGCVAAFAALVIGFFWLAGSSLIDDANTLGGRLTDVARHAVARLPDWLSSSLSKRGVTADASSLGSYALAGGSMIASALLAFFLAVIVTIYLLIEGAETYAWLVAYAPPRYRSRVHVTAREARKAIFGYAVGNAATSVFAAVVVLVSLELLRVPAAFLLALLAGVFDFVPVIGFFCAAIPALLLAMTRSMPVALAVALVYVGEHIVENYYVGPRVYGERLRLSNLAVIIALAVGAEIGGVIGAVLALPFAALYPVIERVWLGEYLGRATTEAHRRLEDHEGDMDDRHPPSGGR
jgi:predicted PurR-regulated permease PerM